MSSIAVHCDFPRIQKIFCRDSQLAIIVFIRKIFHSKISCFQIMLNIFFRIVLLYPIFVLAKSILGSYIVDLFLRVGKHVNKLFVGLSDII